jgi:pyruvate kinase
MRIKTIATLGPSSSERETMRAMVDNGVRIFRLNFSHGSADDFRATVETIRGLERESGIPLTIMGDLSGPKIRIGKLQGPSADVSQGDSVYLGPPEDAGRMDDGIFVPLAMPELLHGLAPSSEVALSDGMLRFEVERVLEPDRLYLLRALNSGILTSHKGITFPGRTVPLAALTDKDRTDLRTGLDLGIDSFALSFVQGPRDIEDIREEMRRCGTQVPVIAKLERENAVRSLDAILDASDGVMVARGDLGLECPLPTLPVTQKRIIKACRHAQKPAIVATQMLLSMVHNPLPTRAETTDVANAILDGADCVMLSEETAVGSYPVDAVRFIREIAAHAEQFLLEQLQGPYPPKKEKNLPKYLAYSACLLAENTDSKALACHTQSGQTAALLSSRRPAQPIYGLTPSMRTVRLLNFYWGVRPRWTDDSLPNHLERVEKFIQEGDLIRSGERVVITSGQPTPGQQERHTNQIKVYYK